MIWRELAGWIGILSVHFGAVGFSMIIIGLSANSDIPIEWSARSFLTLRGIGLIIAIAALGGILLFIYSSLKEKLAHPPSAKNDDTRDR